MANRAAIIAIGTEVVSGQIINTNAATLSQELGAIGIETILHLTVADDREAILWALKQATAQAETILVCGGLGPTRDDFTRTVFAEFVGEPLEFHDQSLTHIRERLGRLGVPVAESNRQQCFYPRGSTVITNTEGTANAFGYSASDKQYWILPGPPREVSAVWKNIAPLISARIPSPERLTLHTWQCLGKSEAELGEIVEKALDGSNLTTGYRVHMPYIEIKVWVPAHYSQDRELWFSKLENAIQPWRMGKTPGEVLKKFQFSLQQLQTQNETVLIFDHATQGYLAEKLRSTDAHLHTEYVSHPKPQTLPTEFELKSQIQNHVKTPNTHVLWAQGFDASGNFAIAHLFTGASHEKWRFKTQSVPYPKTAFLERSGRWITEVAMQTWTEWITS